MRSQSQPQTARPRVVPFVDVLVQSLCEISTVFQLLGDLVAARIHTAKKTDQSEPPDVIAALSAA